MNNNIILIGMPGAGKSTVGVVLAKTIAKQFEDTDLLIQKYTGCCLQDTIDNEGINKFLQIEEKVVSETNIENSVIATGGSVVLSEKAMLHLKTLGKVVYLSVDLEEIKKRIDNITTRGIVMNKGESIEDVFSVRQPLYEKYADITVKQDQNTIESTIESIIKNI